MDKEQARALLEVLCRMADDIQMIAQALKNLDEKGISTYEE